MFTVIRTTLLLILLPIFVIAQEENPLPPGNSQLQYDSAAQFPGGSDSLMKFFEKNIQHTYLKNQKENYVAIAFTVTEKGEVVKIRPVNGIPGHPEILKEVLRVVATMPPWKPASRKGKPVESDVNLSVPIRPTQN